MAIWRGAGGSGDATTDAANQASVASTKAAEAAASATAAASSASSADTSDTQANTSKIAAATSATNSANSATASDSSATASANSATASASSASAGATSASNAATSATNAATSATNASNSASTASTQATNASNSAATASTQASNASTSASNAATSETNAAASFDSFDDRYLGAKSSAPTVDNDGNTLLTGAIYWNTVSNQLFVWDGTAWDAAAFSITGTVTAFNTRTGSVTLNASDVTAAGALMDSELTSIASVKALNQGVATTDSPSFAGLTVDTDTLYVDSANNRVGIGTTSPTSSKLHIDGGDLRIQDVTPNIYLYSEGAVNNVRINANISDVAQGGIEIYENANALIKSRTNFTQFYSANTERMRLDSSGNVGIGDTAPLDLLHIREAVNSATATQLLLQNEGSGN
jgi:hypothetical protein